MPLWKTTTTICAALLFSAPLPCQSLAQQLSPLTPLPMPSAAATNNPDQPESIFYDVEPAVPKTLVQRKPRFSNPLKPMTEPGAPIVKLATRPVFEKSQTATPTASVRHLPAHKVNQAELGRLLGISNAVAPNEPTAAADAAKPAKPDGVPSAAAAELPVARTAMGPTSMLTPLSKSEFITTTKTAVGVTNDFPLAATTPSVVVRSPFVQPGNPNRYLFVVENIGSVDASNTRVDLRVPAGVVLKQVVADSASSTARHAIVRIDELKAGAKAILEVEIQPTNVDVSFDTSLTMETKQSFSGLTLPASGGAGGVTTVAPANTNVASQVSFKKTQPTEAADVAAGNGSLSATVDGPVLLSAGETGEFSIVVKNPNFEQASNIIVQLNIPQGLTITTLDREAWINDEDNTISWELSSVGARHEEVILYKAVGKSFGQQVQKVTLGMDDVYQGDANLVTLVSQ
jgi:hypothetical protein